MPGHLSSVQDGRRLSRVTGRCGPIGRARGRNRGNRSPSVCADVRPRAAIVVLVGASRSRAPAGAESAFDVGGSRHRAIARRKSPGATRPAVSRLFGSGMARCCAHEPAARPWANRAINGGKGDGIDGRAGSVARAAVDSRDLGSARSSRSAGMVRLWSLAKNGSGPPESMERKAPTSDDLDTGPNIVSSYSARSG